MEIRLDFLNYLNHDVSLKIMTCLDDLCDIVRASSVSRDWLHFVIDNGLAKNLCLRMFPQLSKVDHVVEHCCIAQNPQLEAGSSNMEWETLKKEHRVYAFLARGCMSFAESKGCITEAIMASSTDNYPDESIENTLEELDRVGWRPSYWSSKGQSKPEVPETLTYKLVADLCVVTEIRIKPFRAYFQLGSPIYSAKSVLFRMGHLKSDVDNFMDESFPDSLGDDFVWTYTSEEFPMAQEDSLQIFKLPEPILCIGGILQIELRGRVQRQEMDELFYICVAHVQVVGRPLSPPFGIDILEPSENFVLKALSYTQPSLPQETRQDGSAESLDRHVQQPLQQMIDYLRENVVDIGILDYEFEGEDGGESDEEFL
ncbi:hypothetical protein SLA2020_377640 [Shorea laevis]